MISLIMYFLWQIVSLNTYLKWKLILSNNHFLIRCLVTLILNEIFIILFDVVLTLGLTPGCHFIFVVGRYYPVWTSNTLFISPAARVLPCLQQPINFTCPLLYITSKLTRCVVFPANHNVKYYVNHRLWYWFKFWKKKLLN